MSDHIEDTSRYLEQMRINSMMQPDEAMIAAACGDDATKAVDGCIAISAIHGCPLPPEFTGGNLPLKRWWRAMLSALKAQIEAQS